MSLEICRVCLEKGSNLMSLSDEEVSLGDKITACVPEINVFIVNDPQICATCLSMLETAHKFRDKCLLTEQRISKFFESLYLKTVGRLAQTDKKHSKRAVELSEYLNAFILEGLAGINEQSTKTDADDKTLAVKRMQSCYVALNNCVRNPDPIGTPSKQTKDLKKSTNKKKDTVVTNEKTIATNFRVKQTRKTNTTYKNKIYRHVTGTEEFSASVCQTKQVNSKRKDKRVRFDYEEVINKFGSSKTAHPVKGVRGRKRKVVNVNELKTVSEPQTKRPRGRPRKIVVIEQEVNVSSEETTENQLSDSNEEIATNVVITNTPSETCVVDYSVRETEPDVTCTTESEFYEYSVNNLCEICDVVFSNVEGWRRHIKDHIFAV